jgi:hypothetical protein
MRNGQSPRFARHYSPLQLLYVTIRPHRLSVRQTPKRRHSNSGSLEERRQSAIVFLILGIIVVAT